MKTSQLSSKSWKFTYIIYWSLTLDMNFVYGLFNSLEFWIETTHVWHFLYPQIPSLQLIHTSDHSWSYSVQVYMVYYFKIKLIDINWARQP